MNSSLVSEIRILYQGNEFDLGHAEFEVQVTYPGRAILQAIVYMNMELRRDIWAMNVDLRIVNT